MTSYVFNVIRTNFEKEEDDNDVILIKEKTVEIPTAIIVAKDRHQALAQLKEKLEPMFLYINDAHSSFDAEWKFEILHTFIGTVAKGSITGVPSWGDNAPENN